MSQGLGARSTRCLALSHVALSWYLLLPDLGWKLPSSGCQIYKGSSAHLGHSCPNLLWSCFDTHHATVCWQSLWLHNILSIEHVCDVGLLNM